MTSWARGRAKDGVAEALRLGWLPGRDGRVLVVTSPNAILYPRAVRSCDRCGRVVPRTGAGAGDLVRAVLPVSAVASVGVRLCRGCAEEEGLK